MWVSRIGKKGSILGPILFLIYVNDINHCDDSSDFKKFADDTTILSTGSTLQETANNMNSVLAKVNIWVKQNKLNLNPSKTRCMIFNAKTEEENLITIDNTVIERVWDNTASQNAQKNCRVKTRNYFIVD